MEEGRKLLTAKIINADEQQILRAKTNDHQFKCLMTFETSLLNFHREKNQNHKVINKSHRKVIQKQQHVALIRSLFLNGESTTMPFYIVHCKPSFLYLQEEC